MDTNTMYDELIRIIRRNMSVEFLYRLIVCALAYEKALNKK